MSDHDTTYDGLAIAKEKPYLACIVVYREGAHHREILVLHRAHDGPAYEGDWAWTPPAGARLPGEDILACAYRELMEETGLALSLTPASFAIEECAVFAARAPTDCVVTLDGEHDRFEWVSVAEALTRCLPQAVAADIRAAMRVVAQAPR